MQNGIIPQTVELHFLQFKKKLNIIYEIPFRFPIQNCIHLWQKLISVDDILKSMQIIDKINFKANSLWSSQNHIFIKEKELSSQSVNVTPTTWYR